MSVHIPTPPDTYLINGVDLHSLVWQIETRAGLLSAPPLEGEDLEVAGWHGRLDVHADTGQQRRPFGPGSWRATMWLIGVNPSTGSLLDDVASLAACQQRADQLARLVHARTLTVTHVRADGTTRQAAGHLTGDQFAVTLNPASPWFGRVVVDVTLPDPFWYEPVPVTVSATLPNNGVLDLTPFTAATAPFRGCELRFGPGNNPSLSHAGGFFAWDGVISVGRELAVACDPREPALFAGAGAWSPPYSGIRYSPGPSWFELDPTVSTAVLSHTGGGQMPVSVTARIAHLTS